MLGIFNHALRTSITNLLSSSTRSGLTVMSSATTTMRRVLMRSERITETHMMDLAGGKYLSRRDAINGGASWRLANPNALFVSRHEKVHSYHEASNVSTIVGVVAVQSFISYIYSQSSIAIFFFSSNSLLLSASQTSSDPNSNFLSNLFYVSIPHFRILLLAISPRPSLSRVSHPPRPKPHNKLSSLIRLENFI
jgi:hypothetical protein